MAKKFSSIGPWPGGPPSNKVVLMTSGCVIRPLFSPILWSVLAVRIWSGSAFWLNCFNILCSKVSDGFKVVKSKFSKFEFPAIFFISDLKPLRTALSSLLPILADTNDDVDASTPPAIDSARRLSSIESTMLFMTFSIGMDVIKGGVVVVFDATLSSRRSGTNTAKLIFLIGQSRPLFVYFRSFLFTISIQIVKSVDGVLGIRTRGRRW